MFQIWLLLLNLSWRQSAQRSWNHDARQRNLAVVLGCWKLGHLLWLVAFLSVEGGLEYRSATQMSVKLCLYRTFDGFHICRLDSGFLQWGLFSCCIIWWHDQRQPRLWTHRCVVQPQCITTPELLLSSPMSTLWKGSTSHGNCTWNTVGVKAAACTGQHLQAATCSPAA